MQMIEQIQEASSNLQGNNLVDVQRGRSHAGKISGKGPCVEVFGFRLGKTGIGLVKLPHLHMYYFPAVELSVSRLFRVESPYETLRIKFAKERRK